MSEKGRPASSDMSIRMLQTTDPLVYHEMFSATSSVNRAFCAEYGIAYEGYIGIKLGCYPWHATFNRIALLSSLLEEKYGGWVIYVDADAYVADFDFDLHGLLQGHAERAILGAPGGPAEWNINAGILFINFGQAAGRAIVRKWNDRFHTEVGVDRLKRAVNPWEPGLRDDQVLLHEVLQAEAGLERSLTRLPLALVGLDNSRFVRQLLRAYGSMGERTRRAQEETIRILGERGLGNVAAPSSLVADGPDEWTSAGHYFPPFVLLRRALGRAEGSLVTISEPLLKRLITGLIIKGFFDEKWYLNSYPDVEIAIDEGRVANALEHYASTGYYEGRRPGRKCIDAAWYESFYKDVSSAVESGAIADPAQHYNVSGYLEGRAATAEELTEIQAWKEVLRPVEPD
jgi:hypothetical protein